MNVRCSSPAGEWIDYNHPENRYKGGSEATVKAPLEELPMFVRAGSFIPLYDAEIENVGQYDPQFITISYYPSKDKSEYTMFDDNRLSPRRFPTASISSRISPLTRQTGSSQSI